MGYTTITMEAGKWYQIGTPFASLDGKEETVNDVFCNGFTSGDALYVYDSDLGRYSSVITWGTVQEGAWGDEGTWTVSNPILPAGKAVFIRKAATSTICLSGRVSSDVTTVFGDEDATTWSQIVLVYPADTEVNKMKWEGLQEGDALYIYDSASQRYKSALTWTSTIDESGEPKWCNEASWSVSTEKIPAGQALFVRTAGRVSCSSAVSQ